MNFQNLLNRGYFTNTSGPGAVTTFAPVAGGNQLIPPNTYSGNFDSIRLVACSVNVNYIG
jgi:hypothetical protein